jgi:hypothetical protein
MNKLEHLDLLISEGYDVEITGNVATGWNAYAAKSVDSDIITVSANTLEELIQHVYAEAIRQKEATESQVG